MGLSGRARHARSVACLWLCGLTVALAVNVVYDEVLWTKKIWSSAKVSNVLLFSNPSDQDQRLPEVYPSIRGSIANSLDGPNEKRDSSKRPAETDSDGLDGHLMTGMQAITDTSDVSPASAAAQCSVCHVAVAHVWQNLTERLVDNVVLGPRSARAALLNKKVIKKRLMEACKNEVAESLLSKQTILRLSDPAGQLAFYVLRERRGGSSKHSTTAEHKAVRLACKKLILDSGDDLVKTVADTLALFVAQLEGVLKPHDLLGEDIDIPSRGAAGAAGGETGKSTTDGTAGGGGGGEKPFVPSDPAGTPWPKMWTRSLQASSLVKEVLRRVWPSPGATASAPQPSATPLSDADGDDDEYEDVDEDALDPECMDLHPMCLTWADKGECEANPNYMVGSPVHKGHCKKSCGVCTPRKKGERSPADLIDNSELKAAIPGLASQVERVALPLQQALCNSACGASKACLTGVAGTAAGQGFVANAMGHVASNTGWNLEKPHFGRANVDKLSAKELKALEKTLSGHAPAEPGSVAAEVDKELSAELKGKVLSVAGDFFIYEYVYKNHTRHYHVTDTGALTEDYHLGSFKRESVDILSATTGTTSVLEEKDLLPSMRATLMRKDWPYVKQVYSGGDACILGGGRHAVRKSEVRIACSFDSNIHMLVREPDFCQYVFVIYSPSLCKVERFKPRVKVQARGQAAAEEEEGEDVELEEDDDDDDEYE